MAFETPRRESSLHSILAGYFTISNRNIMIVSRTKDFGIFNNK